VRTFQPIKVLTMSKLSARASRSYKQLQLNILWWAKAVTASLIGLSRLGLQSGPAGYIVALIRKCPIRVEYPPCPAALVDRGTSGILLVKDANGQQIAYLYFEDEPQRQMSMKRLSRDEARQIAANIAKLPMVPSQP
jgi:hypothetical protein